MPKTKKTDSLNDVKAAAQKLLDLMGVSSEVAVSADVENDSIIVDIKSEQETGLLIGNRGRTLSSIQAILGMINRQKTGEWKRILVNIADWREKEEGRLKDLAIQVAERAKETKETQTLYNLNAQQRRIIHMTLSEYPDIETESVGEGDDRYLLVKPKADK